MKNITITLTEKEIDALQISICANKLKLEEDIERLKEHNLSGVNTKLIRQKAERILEIEDLFDKLCLATKLME